MKTRKHQRGFVEWAIPAAVALYGALSGNKQRKETAEDQMAFQNQQSSTAYQRAVLDMQAAGLNPMLAYQQGGASAGSGAQAQIENAGATAVNSAQMGSNMAQISRQGEMTDATTDQIKAQTSKIRSETLTNELNTAWLATQIRARNLEGQNTEAAIPGTGARSQSDIVKSLVEQGAKGYENTGFAADVRRRKADATLSELEIPKSKAEADFFKTDFGSQTPLIRSILNLLRGASTARRAIQ